MPIPPTGQNHLETAYKCPHPPPQQRRERQGREGWTPLRASGRPYLQELLGEDGHVLVAFHLLQAQNIFLRVNGKACRSTKSLPVFNRFIISTRDSETKTRLSATTIKRFHYHRPFCTQAGGSASTTITTQDRGQETTCFSSLRLPVLTAPLATRVMIPSKITNHLHKVVVTALPSQR